MVETRTFRVLEDFEEKSFQELHHFFTKREVLKLLAKFAKANVQPLTGGKKDKPHYYYKNNSYQVVRDTTAFSNNGSLRGAGDISMTAWVQIQPQRES